MSTGSPHTRSADGRARARLLVVTAGVALTGMAGWAGSSLVGSDGRAVAAGTMALAVATGFTAFFSPCSFPMMLTFLTRRSAETGPALAAGAVRVGLGAGALLGTVGLLAMAGGEAIARVLGFDQPAGRAFRVAVGLLLVVLGLRQAGWLHGRLRWMDRLAAAAATRLDPSRRATRWAADVAYGFAYPLVGFG